MSISNCTIRTGDDSIILRANNVALKENKVCENVTVTNCTLSSYTSGVRIGWTNGGTIRNCTLSNIVMTDCANGVAISLPVHGGVAVADVGREATLIENISFSNIMMDRIFWRPVAIWIEHNPLVRCAGIRRIYFDGVRSRSCQFPSFVGREDAVISDIEFNSCKLEISPLASPVVLPQGAEVYRPRCIHARNIRYTNTEISATGFDEYESDKTEFAVYGSHGTK